MGLLLVGRRYLMASVREGRSVGIEVVAVGMAGLGRHRRRVERYFGVGTVAWGVVILLGLVSCGSLLLLESLYLGVDLQGLVYKTDLEPAVDQSLAPGIRRHTRTVAGFDVHQIELGAAATLTLPEETRSLDEP